MGVSRRKNNLESDFLIGLPSEICGFKDGVYHAPKSFKNFGSNTNNCYNGLFYLLGDFNNSKDFKIYRNKHTPLDRIENPLIIQVYISILAILEDLRKNARILFEKREEYSVMYKGKINFSKTFTKNNGLMRKTYKTVNELNNNSLERKFLHLAFKKFPSQINNYLPDASKNDFYKILSECNYHLLDIDPVNCDLLDLSIQIIRKPVESGESARLLSNCKIIAEFLLQNKYHDFPSKGSLQKLARSKIEYNDFHLNLNRPFEKLLKEICLKLPESKIPRKEFSKIVSNVSLSREKKAALAKADNTYRSEPPQKGEFKHSLIPDVWKVINLESEKNETDPCLLILDAKHKEFANLSDELADDDPFIQYNRIARSDLHQLITYIRTNLIDNVRGIFGFFGFIQESIQESSAPNYSSPFVDCSRDALNMPNPLVLNISDSGREQLIYINILGLRFGTLLSFIGNACELSKTHPGILDDLYCRLAIELTHCLHKNEVVIKNQTVQKTLNSRLNGACRNLFFVYQNSADYLSKIGIHTIQHFLKIDCAYTIVNSNIIILHDGGHAKYSEIKTEKNHTFFVIDSEDDPARIKDLNIITGLFERDDSAYIMIITRAGMTVFRDGVVPLDPSSLID